MSDESLLLVEQRGYVQILTLNRPDAMNAFNAELAHALADALNALDADTGVRVGVLAGAGRGFSAGMDLKEFAAGGGTGGMPNPPGRGFAGITERSAAKPLIAAVEGFALAGGLEVALACDVIVAAEGARLGIPEVKVGLFAGAGALLRLPRRVPYGLAMEMALTGEPLTAEDAHSHGLVDRLCPPGETVEAAVALAERIAANAPLGVRASKRLLRDVLGVAEDDYWAFQRPLISEVFDSADAIEGATAFAEKREPVWEDR